MIVLRLVIALICYNTALTTYDYMIGFARWKTTIPGGKGYLCIECGSKQCSVTVIKGQNWSATESYLLHPYTSRWISEPLEDPSAGSIIAIQLRTKQRLAVIAGTVSQKFVYDLFPVYPIEEGDTIFFLHSPPKNAFLLMFSVASNYVEIACQDPNERTKVNITRRRIYTSKGLFFDLEQCTNADISVRPGRSRWWPFNVFLGTTTVQRCVRSTRFGGSRFLMASPMVLNNTLVQFIGLHPSTFIKFQTEKGGWRGSSVHRTSLVWRDQKHGDTGKTVTVSFQTLFIKSSKDILVVINFNSQSSNAHTAMSLAPFGCYNEYSFTLTLHYPSRDNFSRQVVLIARKDLIQYIMVNGHYYFRSKDDWWPIIRGQTEYTWIVFYQYFPMVINVTDTYMIPGLMYVILIGNSSKGGYITEAPGDMARNVTGTLEVLGMAGGSAKQEDFVPLVIVLPLVAILCLIVTVSVVGLVVKLVQRRRKAASHTGGDEATKSTSNEQHEENAVE